MKVCEPFGTQAHETSKLGKNHSPEEENEEQLKMKEKSSKGWQFLNFSLSYVTCFSMCC